MCPAFRSPSTPSIASATAPARLAERFNAEVLWRERPGGELDVAVMQDGVIDRYVVHEDGTETLVGSSPPSLPQRWGGRVAMGAWLVGLATIIALGITAPDGTGSSYASGGLLALWFACFALFWIGGSLGAKLIDLEGRLKKLPGGEGDWHPPTKLNGWMPRSSEQLTAVERIADEHDGLALVRDIGARTVDVCGVRRGSLERYWVDEVGRAELAETTPGGARQLVYRVLSALAIAIVLGVIAVWVAVDENKAMFLIALVVALPLVIVAAWRSGRPLRLEQRVRRVGADNAPWIEIRTLIVESDGE